MAAVYASKYAHSPIHIAIVSKDYVVLKTIISNLPCLCEPAKIFTDSLSLSEELKADAVISAVIDNRDVPNRDTPLYLAVKLGDEIAVEMLMSAGADCTLQNEQGWSAFQEAICKREDKIAKIIVKRYQPIAWAKWCRRLPRVVGAMTRMRDFYMEITFQFESSLIPFISKIAPSDTYKIWKRGANLRADMTLAGFDGFKIQRMDQSVLFLGDGSADGMVSSGSLCMVNHKDKEVMNAVENAGVPASDSDVNHEVAAMFRKNILRPGIDVTEAVILPQMTWRWKERTETIGPWKTRVYDMHNVVISLKSRKAPGPITDDELFTSCNEPTQSENSIGGAKDDLIGDSSGKKGRHSRTSSTVSGKMRKDVNKEKEIKNWLKPTQWLSQNFPLQTEELLPLLDILASKVKAIRRLRELLTTKLPTGTFPVKVAIPVVPTMRVLVTFTKFEVEPIEELLSPPLKSSSPSIGSTSGLFDWVKAPHHKNHLHRLSIGEHIQDPFAIPPDYKWVTIQDMKRKRIEEKKAKKAKTHNQKSKDQHK